MDGKPLCKVDTIKFLGVHIDSKLNWSDHISSIATQVSRGIGVLSKLKYTLPRKILRTIYSSLYLPHLSYCSTIW